MGSLYCRDLRVVRSLELSIDPEPSITRRPSNHAICDGSNTKEDWSRTNRNVDDRHSTICRNSRPTNWILLGISAEYFHATMVHQQRFDRRCPAQQLPWLNTLHNWRNRFDSLESCLPLDLRKNPSSHTL